MPDPDPLTIAVLATDGAPLFETSVPLGVFGVDRSSAGVPRFQVLPFAVSGAGSQVRTTAGVRLVVPFGLEVLRSAGTVIVPTWSGHAEQPDPRLLTALTEAHQGGARIVGLCLGAFVLAAAGLLDGRRATTHWLRTPALAERFPAVRVDQGVLYVEDRGVLTSAGSAAGLDACLHLLRQDHGAAVAATVARRMVVPPHRAGGQAQYVEAPGSELAEGHPVIDAASWAMANLGRPVDIDELAGRAFMSRRGFDRRFRELTGTSPLRWLLHQRVLRAQHLLETTALTVDAVARAVGFGSAVTLRPHFRRLVGVAPQVYRETFRAATGEPARSAGME